MTMKMPTISACDVSDCVYNTNRQCHTMAVTVGGPESCARCDTYLHASQKGGVSDMTGGVGACKVNDCSFNSSFECSAPSINVGQHQGHADCTTFRHR